MDIKNWQEQKTNKVTSKKKSLIIDLSFQNLFKNFNSDRNKFYF
jgi:hypothetical protein